MAPEFNDPAGRRFNDPGFPLEWWTKQSHISRASTCCRGGSHTRDLKLRKWVAIKHYRFSFVFKINMNQNSEIKREGWALKIIWKTIFLMKWWMKFNWQLLKQGWKESKSRSQDVSYSLRSTSCCWTVEQPFRRHLEFVSSVRSISRQTYLSVENV